MTDTAFEYRRHFDEAGDIVVAEGVHRYETTIDDEDLGDEAVLVHEIAHVISRHRYGPDSDVHGPEYVRIKDLLRTALGHEPTGDIW